MKLRDTACRSNFGQEWVKYWAAKYGTLEQTFVKEYVLTPTLFVTGTVYSVTVTPPDTLEPWITVGAPAQVSGGGSVPVTVEVTPPAWLQEGHTYAFQSNISLTDAQGGQRQGTLNFEVTQTGQAVELHTYFSLGEIPMVELPLSGSGVINARVAACAGGGGGWAWTPLPGGGGFVGTRPGDAGDGAIANPVTGATGTPGEVTGDESQEVRLALDQRLMLEGESFRASLVPASGGSLGTGWAHNYDVRLDLSGAGGPPNTVVYRAAHGTPLYFEIVKGEYRPAPGVYGTLVRTEAITNQYVYTLTAANQATYVFDNDGRLTSQFDPQGNVTNFSYNPQGQLEQVSEPVSGRYLDLTYDAGGNRRRVTDPNEHTTSYDYDALNRVVTTTNHLGGQTIIAYDKVGNRTGVIDARENQTVYRYDSRIAWSRCARTTWTAYRREVLRAAT